MPKVIKQSVLVLLAIGMTLGILLSLAGFILYTLQPPGCRDGSIPQNSLEYRTMCLD